MIVRKLEIKIDPSSLDQAIREAEHYLAHADPVMRRLIARHGPCPLAEREFEPFHMLANSIISQQLSTKAAATIKQRVGELVGVPFQTEKVLAVSSENYATLACHRQRHATSASLQRGWLTDG